MTLGSAAGLRSAGASWAVVVSLVSTRVVGNNSRPKQRSGRVIGQLNVIEAKEGCSGQFVFSSDRGKMVNVDQEANRKELDASGLNRGGSLEQGRIHGALVVVEKAVGGDVRDVEWAVTHVEGRKAVNLPPPNLFHGLLLLPVTW